MVICIDHFLLLGKGRVGAMALAKRSCSHSTGDPFHLSLRIGFLRTGRFLNLVHRKGKLQINQRLVGGRFFWWPRAVLVGLINVSTVVGGTVEVLVPQSW